MGWLRKEESVLREGAVSGREGGLAERGVST